MSEHLIWNELGNIYFKLGAHDEAIAALSRAIELSPGKGSPYSNLGLVYYEKGDYSKAIVLYLKSIELYESSKDKAISWNRLGDAYRQLNDYNSAIKAYQQAVEFSVQQADVETEPTDLLTGFEQNQRENFEFKELSENGKLDDDCPGSTETEERSNSGEIDFPEVNALKGKNTLNSIQETDLKASFHLDEPFSIEKNFSVKSLFDNPLLTSIENGSPSIKNHIDDNKNAEEKQSLKPERLQPELYTDQDQTTNGETRSTLAQEQSLEDVESPKNITPTPSLLEFDIETPDPAPVKPEIHGNLEEELVDPEDTEAHNQQNQPSVQSKEVSNWLRELLENNTSFFDPEAVDPDLQEWLQRPPTRSPLNPPTKPRHVNLERETRYRRFDPNCKVEDSQAPNPSTPTRWKPAEPMSTATPQMSTRNSGQPSDLLVDEIEQPVSKPDNRPDTSITQPMRAKQKSVVEKTNQVTEKPSTIVDLSVDPQGISTESKEKTDNSVLDAEVKDEMVTVPETTPEETKDEVEEAILVYKKITESAPTNDRAWDTLGKLYQAKGRYAEAVASFEKAIVLYPTREVYHYHLGLSQAAQKKHQDAITTLQRVIELNPGHVLAHCALAGSHRRLNQRDEATLHLEIISSKIKAENEYNRACFEAISGNAEQAVELLKIAVQKNQTELEWLKRDPDLDFIREHPLFQALVSQNGTDGTK